MADTSITHRTARSSGSPPSTKGSPTKATTKPASSRSFVAYVFNTVARIFTWYCIFVLLFRCPSTLEECDASSPRICKPYFQVKQAVAPHVQKHYDAYAAPYVEVIKPYYETVDRAVVGPTWTYVVKYGAPQVKQVQTFGYTQWDKNIQPQLAKAQDVAAKQYSQVLGPHVDKVSTTVAPYYEIARNNALQTHHDVILPTYELISPYALQGYSAVSTFATGTVVPAVVWSYSVTADFVDAKIVPQLRVIYADTVEPQLEKLGQKLGLGSKSYQSTIHRTVHTTAASSFKKPAQYSTSTTSTKVSTTTQEPETSYSATAPASASSASSEHSAGITEAAKLKRPEPIVQDKGEPDEDEERQNARKEVAEDLRAWQDKYAKAADEGAIEIEKRVEEISKRIIRRNARTTGKGLVDQLTRVSTTNLFRLREEINLIVGSVIKGTATEQEAEEEIVAAVRRAGVEIKEKAQAVRSWREEYGKELQDTISRAAENHFQILGGIRDLALQKIGMKWAWMEGVTYKDWAKYHQLKGRFEEWENDLEQLIVTHPGLEEAQSVGQAIEDEAMLVAQTAAKELARLKQVSSLKLELKDDSDEFDADTIKANAEAAAAAAKAAEEAAAAEAAAAEAAAAEAAAAEAAAAEAAAAEAAAAEEAAAAAKAAEAEAATSESHTSEQGTTAENADALYEEPATKEDSTAVAEDAETTTEAADESIADGADASTVAPEEVPIVLGETTGVVDDLPRVETTLPDDEEKLVSGIPVEPTDGSIEIDDEEVPVEATSTASSSETATAEDAEAATTTTI